MARGAFSRAGAGDADVEDAVQETLLAIHLKRHTWDAEQPLAPWVYAIARHKIVDALRRRGGGGSSRSRISRIPGRAGGGGPARAERRAEAPRDTGPRQRDIVTSISLDGQSIAATAKRLSMSEVAVRVALHRALKSLGAAWRRSVE